MRSTLALCLALIAGSAYAAGPFDGKWTGTMRPEGACQSNVTVEMTVTNNMISGTILADRPTPEGYTKGTIIPNGPIAPDGTANAVIGTATRYPTAFRFTGDAFAGNFSAHCGVRSMSGSRVK